MTTKGTSLTEYVMLCSLVVLVSAGAMQLLGNSTSNLLQIQSPENAQGTLSLLDPAQGKAMPAKTADTSAGALYYGMAASPGSKP